MASSSSPASFALYGNPVLSLSKPSRGVVAASASRIPIRAICQASSGSDDGVKEKESSSVHLSRRHLAIAAMALAISARASPDLAQAARKKGPDEAPKPSPKEDKDVSGYDAKVRATYRRKEALKEAMAKLKERSAAKKEEASPPPRLDSIKAKPSPNKEIAPPKTAEADAASTPPPDAVKEVVSEAIREAEPALVKEVVKEAIREAEPATTVKEVVKEAIREAEPAALSRVAE